MHEKNGNGKRCGCLAEKIPIASRHWIGMHGFDPDVMTDKQLLGIGALMAMDADLMRYEDWKKPLSGRSERILAMYEDALNVGDMDTVKIIEKVIKETK